MNSLTFKSDSGISAAKEGRRRERGRERVSSPLSRLLYFSADLPLSLSHVLFPYQRTEKFPLRSYFPSLRSAIIQVGRNERTKLSDLVSSRLPLTRVVSLSRWYIDMYVRESTLSRSFTVLFPHHLDPLPYALRHPRTKSDASSFSQALNTSTSALDTKYPGER
ncbi:hypothetical protein BDY24DRAFT_391099 [Mrakia frigida]|uniref:uncharacterized protein n=1 Tax=Mrakia frigida TaxID=29902 RepID=UPI003FCC1EB9